jgi:hypothetical protein
MVRSDYNESNKAECCELFVIAATMANDSLCEVSTLASFAFDKASRTICLYVH